MATTSYLYHILRLIHHRLIRTEFKGGAIYYHVVMKREKRVCCGCGAPWWQIRLAWGFRHDPYHVVALLPGLSAQGGP